MFNLATFTDIISDEIPDSQPMSLSINNGSQRTQEYATEPTNITSRPKKHTGQHGEFRSVEEIDPKYREVFTYPFFNLVQSRVIEDALYSDKSIVVCAPTGSGKTVVFEMAIVQLLMDIEEKKYDKDFKIIYMAPVKALCTERLTEWYSKFTKLGLLCIEVTGDTDVDVSHLKPYRVIITTPEKWDMLTRRWRDHRGLVELIKLFLIDEVHILNDEARGPVLEAVVSRMKTIESSTQSEYRIEQLQRQYQSSQETKLTSDDSPPPRIRFVAVSATVSNPEDVATWLGNSDKPAVYYKFGDECRPVKLKRVVEGYPCPDGTSIFKFDIILNYKLWPVIQKYHNGKPTLIFCNTRKSVALTAEALSREITISFNPEQRAKLSALASTIKNKKLQALVLAGVGCHHAGLLFEERVHIENAFRNRDLPILITTTTLAMGVNLPAHLVIIKNTQQYVNGAYQEYSISTVLQMVGRAGRPQFDTEATAVIMTRISDKPRYEALVCGSEPLQSYLHQRLPENLNSEAALGTVNDVAQCVQWLRSTFLYVRAARDPKRYLGLPNNAPSDLISKKIEELCVRAMNGLATAGLISMDEASCIESTEAGRLMSIFYLDLETMKHIMKIEGTATLEQLLWVVCESHELADMHLRVDERRFLNALNRNNSAPTIRFPMKGKISTRQMKLNCIIQAVLGCLPIPDASLNQEAMKIMRTADRVCKCLVAYVTRHDLISQQPKFFSAVLNSLILAKCITAHLWENSPYVSKQLKGIGPTFSTLLATAGKINFMLLEESHPRDLERIMKKGPPAGNVLRKQISLLPKYQITMSPVNEKVVTVQLSLLNHNYLAENMQNLTAGDRHKSYIVVGDSENQLLLLKSFQDKDLIGMYDGVITQEIERRHIFEHKIIVHCISSLFVGIDTQSEYIFKDLNPAPVHVDVNTCYFNNDTLSSKTKQKQTCITDIYKERKRKSNCDSEISQSREKKKRENALTEKIRLLKESFGRASKEAKEEYHKSANMSNKIVQEIVNIDKNVLFENIDKASLQIDKNTEFIENSVKKSLDNVNNEGIDRFDNNYSIDDTKINDILKDIESEISKELEFVQFSGRQCNNTRKNMKVPTVNHSEYLKRKNTMNTTNKSLKNKVDFNEDEENHCKNDTGFSNAIKSHMNKYFQQTQLSSKKPDISIEMLIEDKNYPVSKTDDEPENVINKPLDFSMEQKESVINSKPKKYINVIDLTESKESQNRKDSKLDTQFLSPPSILPVLSNDSNTEEIDIMRKRTISHESHDFYQNSILIQNITSQETIDNDDIDITAASPEISENYTNECDKDKKQLVSNKVQGNFDDLGIISKDEENPFEDYRFPSITVSDDSLVVQSRDESNDMKTKRNYIRNFSYAAMNFDISTNRAADHHVHVIKKIKVDLDITEIILRDNSKQDNNSLFACDENPFKLIPCSQILQRPSIVRPPESTTNKLTLKAQDNISVNRPISIDQNDSLLNLQSLKQLTYSDNLINKDDEKSSNAYYDSNNSLEALNQITTNQHVYKSMFIKNFTKTGDNIPQNQNSINLKQTNDNLEEETDETLIEKHNEDAISKKKEVESGKADATEIGGTLNERGERAIIEDIRNKLLPSTCSAEVVFAFNLHSTDVKTSTAVTQEAKSNCIEQKIPDYNDKIIPKITEAKVSKSDIKNTFAINANDNSQKNEKTLENILQKYSQSFRQLKKEENLKNTSPLICKEPQINTFKNKRPFKITDIDKIEPKLPPFLIAETPIYTSAPKNKRVIAGENVIPEIPTSNISSNKTAGVTDIKCREEKISQDTIELTTISSKDFITNDCKIDDSMLNPKILLQSLTKDEPEIIPPPPEFSDLNYSPSQSIENEDNIYESMDNQASLHKYENVKISPNLTYAEFNDESLTNSSNELETILLSNNDYDDNIETRPWTVTQSSSFRDVANGNGFTARRANLNHFKFTNKKRLKIKL